MMFASDETEIFKLNEVEAFVKEIKRFIEKYQAQQDQPEK